MTYHLGILELERRQHAVATADPAVRDLAQLRVDEGNAMFRAGNYDGAIRLYTEAWTLYPAPNMLLLIGVTLLRLGRFRDASFRFQRYLRENPEGDRRVMAEEQLAAAQVAMERQAAAADASGTPAPVAPAPPAEIPPDVLAAKRARVQTAQQAQQEAPLPTSMANPYAEQTYGVWIATGVGVVGVIGLGWWLLRRKKAPTPNRRRRR